MKTDGLHNTQKLGRRYDRGYTSLAFASGLTALGYIDPNNNNKIDYRMCKCVKVYMCNLL